MPPVQDLRGGANIGTSFRLAPGRGIKLVGGQFIVETNGIAIGHDPSLLDLLKPLKCHIRLTIKGDDPDSFQKVTGAFKEAFAYQLQAVEAIRKAEISLSVAVIAQFVDDSGKLPWPVYEEEELIMYQSTERILRSRGF